MTPDMLRVLLLCTATMVGFSGLGFIIAGGTGIAYGLVTASLIIGVANWIGK